MWMTRRKLAGMMASTAAFPAWADTHEAAFFRGSLSDHGFDFRKTNFDKIDRAWHRQLVGYPSTEAPGTIVVDTAHHFLYVIFENQTALRYGVGVGKEGFQWFGQAEIQRKALWPDWVPPPEMLLRRPELPKHMAGGPDNPRHVSVSRRARSRLPPAWHHRALEHRRRCVEWLHPHVS